ncbi:hypothetical protein ACJJTC_009123 [Scirpophaga incertulas]
MLRTSPEQALSFIKMEYSSIAVNAGCACRIRTFVTYRCAFNVASTMKTNSAHSIELLYVQNGNSIDLELSAGAAGTLLHFTVNSLIGSSRAKRDPRLRGREDNPPDKCFDTEHRLLVKTPEAKQQIVTSLPRTAKRQQEDDENINARITKQKIEGKSTISSQQDFSRPPTPTT